MPSISVVEHRGHTVVRTKFPRGTDLNGIRSILTDAAFVYAQLPHGKILALVDFDDTELEEEKVFLIEAVAKANAEAVLATALLGVAQTQQDLYRQMLRQMHRNALLFETAEEALNWLADEADGHAWLADGP